MNLNRAFTPCTLLGNPHLQTIWPRFFNSNKTHYPKERLELTDGDFVDLSWTANPEPGQAIIIIFHGLEGCVESPYVQGIMRAITVHGWVAVLMHFRGCSGEPNRLPRSYHSGDTADIQFCIDHLHIRYANNPLFALGYSLGGNALLKYLGEQQTTTPLQAAIAVSVPFELNRGADKLNQGFSKFYQWYLVGKLRDKMRQKFKQQTASIDISNLDSYRDFWQFDHCVTAPLHGFESAKEYYRLSSSRQYLNHIKIPTLLIHAQDDPFLPIDAIPTPHDLSNTVQLELCKHGGHVGFISGSNPFKPKFWLEQRIPEYIQTFMNY